MARGKGAYLDEVPDGGGPEAGEEGGGALFCDDEAATGEEGLALHGGVDLYARLYDVNRYSAREYVRGFVGRSSVRVMPPWVTLSSEDKWECGGGARVVTYVQHSAPTGKRELANVLRVRLMCAYLQGRRKSSPSQ